MFSISPWQQTGSGEREIPYSDKLGVLRVPSLPRTSQQRNLPSRQENLQLPGDDVEARPWRHQRRKDAEENGGSGRLRVQRTETHLICDVTFVLKPLILCLLFTLFLNVTIVFKFSNVFCWYRNYSTLKVLTGIFKNIHLFFKLFLNVCSNFLFI